MQKVDDEMAAKAYTPEGATDELVFRLDSAERVHDPRSCEDRNMVSTYFETEWCCWTGDCSKRDEWAWPREDTCGYS